MTSAFVVERLGRRLEGFDDLPEPDDDVECLLRHLLVGAAILPGHSERYRRLRRQLEDEGTSDGLRAAALEAAGDLAAVLQGAARQNASAVALADMGLRPLELLGALGQLFASFVVLTAPEPDDAGTSMTADELDDLLATPGLEDWLDPESAVGRMAPPA